VLKVELDVALPGGMVRMGPLEPGFADPKVLPDDRPVEFSVVRGGDSRWVRLRVPAGASREPSGG